MSVHTLPTVATLQALKPLERFDGFGAGSLIVNSRSWPVGTPVEAVLDGSAVPDRIVATSDGRHVADPLGWHTDGSEGEWVEYERYSVVAGELRLDAHGFIDSVSRKLLQSG